ncbi:MAG: hypothetical protein LKF36_12745 [Lactobacillus sp.]|jgi:hypothetical protein|nr:hypothetical protein [Lactobacillus sp.]
MKVLAMRGSYNYLVVENNGMYYVISGNEGDRIEQPASAYKFGYYTPYDGGLTKARLREIEALTEQIGDDLPDWYRNAKED